MEPDRELPHGSRGVDHVAIAVRDIDAALEFYVHDLGLTVVHDERLLEPDVRLTYIDAGNVTLQLVQPFGEGQIASFLAERGEGLHHICLSVEAIDGFLQSSAFAPDGPIFMGGRGRLACFLSQRPNDVVFEITEVKPVGDRGELD